MKWCAETWSSGCALDVHPNLRSLLGSATRFCRLKKFESPAEAFLRWDLLERWSRMMWRCVTLFAFRVLGTRIDQPMKDPRNSTNFAQEPIAAWFPEPAVAAMSLKALRPNKTWPLEAFGGQNQIPKWIVFADSPYFWDDWRQQSCSFTFEQPQGSEAEKFQQRPLKWGLGQRGEAYRRNGVPDKRCS